MDSSAFTTSENQLCITAMSYAQRGWAVFPCLPHKKTPHTQHGCLDATTDLPQIARWWSMWPYANVAIATGANSGLIALDIDSYSGGEESLAVLQQRYGALPSTVEQQTGGGGRQLFFRHPGGVVRNSAGELGAGIDVRGDGGYVVAPPSIHPSSRTYEWEFSSSPDNCELAELLPAWVALLRSTDNGNGTRSESHEDAEPIREGQRNARLFKLATSFRAKGMSRQGAKAALLAENTARCQPPLGVDEIDRIIESAWKYAPGESHEDPAKTTPVKLRALSLGDFLRMEIKPREMVLGPIIPTQGLVMLHAIRGVGKTYAALGMAYAVATGGAFLKWKAEKSRRVLYVDGELPAIVLQERLMRLVESFDVEPPNEECFQIITPDLQESGIPDLSTKEGQAAIESQLNGAEFVVLDNLSTLCRSGEENAAESWLSMQEWILSLRRRGIAVLIIHHGGKNGSQRGTSRREDVLDTVICLKHPTDYTPDQGARFEVHFEKARGLHGPDVSPFEAHMQNVDDTLTLTWICKDLDVVLTEKVAALLKEGMSQRAISQELKVALSTVNHHAKKAKAKGVV